MGEFLSLRATKTRDEEFFFFGFEEAVCSTFVGLGNFSSSRLLVLSLGGFLSWRKNFYLARV